MRKNQGFPYASYKNVFTEFENYLKGGIVKVMDSQRLCMKMYPQIWEAFFYEDFSSLIQKNYQRLEKSFWQGIISLTNLPRLCASAYPQIVEVFFLGKGGRA